MAKISSCLVMGGEDMGRQKRSLSGIVDIVVASPGRLLKHRNAGNVFLSNVEHIVIDEVCYSTFVLCILGWCWFRGYAIVFNTRAVPVAPPSLLDPFVFSWLGGYHVDPRLWS